MDDWRSSVVREIGLVWETGTLYRLRFRRNLLNEIKGIGTGGDFLKELCHHLRNSDDDGTHVEWEGDEEEGGGQKKNRKIHKPQSYHYKIGEYYKSSFFKKNLSEEVMRLPGQTGNATICNLAAAQSLNSTSSF